MNTPLIIALALCAFAFVATLTYAACVWFEAPYGWQDQNGFHLGRGEDGL